MQPAKKIKRDKTPEQAYAALIRLCARSEKSSGDALRLMQRWGVEPSARQGVLQKLTSSTIKGVIFGTLITGVIQSSAGTVVICVGLVNSGIMTLTQSVGVIMGANIGTTVTGQLIRMADISGESLLLTLIQPKTFAPVVAFVGCIFYVFLRSAKRKNIGQIMLGFGILFTGMSLMDTGVSPLRESEAFIRILTSFSNPILGILVGLAFTSVLQSASAAVGILQALAITGAVTFEVNAASSVQLCDDEDLFD